MAGTIPEFAISSAFAQNFAKLCSDRDDWSDGNHAATGCISVTRRAVVSVSWINGVIEAVKGLVRALVLSTCGDNEALYENESEHLARLGVKNDPRLRRQTNKSPESR